MALLKQFLLLLCIPLSFAGAFHYLHEKNFILYFTFFMGGMFLLREYKYSS